MHSGKRSQLRNIKPKIYSVSRVSYIYRFKSLGHNYLIILLGFLANIIASVSSCKSFPGNCLVFLKCSHGTKLVRDLLTINPKRNRAGGRELKNVPSLFFPNGRCS